MKNFSLLRPATLLPLACMAMAGALGCATDSSTRADAGLADDGPVRADSTASWSAQPGDTLSLRVGETARVGRDMVLAFDRVEEDSRCPEDVTCITAGNARLAFSFRRGSDAATRVELNTTRPPRDTVVGSYRLTLHGLAPIPNSRRTIDSGAYIATVSLLPE